MTRAPEPLTTAQQELYDWLADYIGTHRHSPSIRQMMQAMGLRFLRRFRAGCAFSRRDGSLAGRPGAHLQLLGDMVGAAGFPCWVPLQPVAW